ncbi:MAG: hypothetical protein QM645_09100 [Asticcacaulis sp.]
MGDILLEYRRNGAYLKVIAVDSETGEEVSAMGPASDPVSVKNLAVQKLKNKLQTLKPPRPGYWA